MDDELALLLAMTMHGSCFVKDSLRVLPDRPFDVLGDVAAVHIAPLEVARGKPTGPPVAAGMLPWFLYLRQRRARRVLLTHLGSDVTDVPEHVMSGFIGGVNWGMLVEGHDRAELVLARLGRIDRRAADAAVARPGHRRRVTLGTQRLDGLVVPPLPRGPIQARLETAIAEMLEVANAGGVEHWAMLLAEAVAGSSAGEPRPARLIVPGCYSDQATKLVRMAAAVWLFGGPGTFSDSGEVPVYLRDRLARAADSLYDACVLALQAGANSVWLED